jgi:hypothetical protein
MRQAPAAVPVTTTLSGLQTCALHGPVVRAVAAALVLHGSSRVANATSSGQSQLLPLEQDAIATRYTPAATTPVAIRPVTLVVAKAPMV